MLFFFFLLFVVCDVKTTEQIVWQYTWEKRLFALLLRVKLRDTTHTSVWLQLA